MLLLSYRISWCTETNARDTILVKILNHNRPSFTFQPSETDQPDLEIDDIYVWFKPSKDNPSVYVQNEDLKFSQFYSSDDKFMTKLSFDVNRFAKTVKQS
jgi:hypothetical protein